MKVEALEREAGTSEPVAPGPGSPRTGLRPWGGDLDFETWDTTPTRRFVSGHDW